jgi:hypothetical protein
MAWRAWLSDIILKGTDQGTIPDRFCLIWFSGFREEDLNVIFYQNIPNLHNWYKSAERKISHFIKCLSTFHILIFSSETTGPIATRLWWNGICMALFQNCVR